MYIWTYITHFIATTLTTFTPLHCSFYEKVFDFITAKKDVSTYDIYLTNNSHERKIVFCYRNTVKYNSNVSLVE